MRVIGVEGIGEVREGDDVAALVVAALDAAGERLEPGDVVVVSSKVVSKAEGRVLAADSREAAVAAETVRIVAERVTPRGLTRVVASRSGPVLAAAGVDASNVVRGSVLLLPADPDAGARRLRAALTAHGGVQPIGVVVSDTAGRAWRDGQTDLAIGAAGIRVADDLRGGTDGYGNPLEATVRALADELAAAADLVKGKLRGVPVAVVRGLDDVVTAEDGPGAAALLRGPGEDWFALGHVEAVRTSLGVPPGTPGVPPVPVPPDDVTSRLRRAATVALTAPDPFDPSGSGPGPGTIDVLPGEAPNTATGRGLGEAIALVRAGAPSASAQPALGALVQRLLAAAWAEGLDVRITSAPDGTLVTATAVPSRA